MERPTRSAATTGKFLKVFYIIVINIINFELVSTVDDNVAIRLASFLIYFSVPAANEILIV